MSAGLVIFSIGAFLCLAGLFSSAGHLGTADFTRDDATRRRAQRSFNNSIGVFLLGAAIVFGAWLVALS